MKGFKVLFRRFDPEGTLALFSAVETDYRVVYRKNEPATPKPSCGPLAVFTRLDDAIKFTKLLVYPTEIRSCEYTPSSTRCLFTPDKRTENITATFPSTDFADSVTVQELICQSKTVVD